MPANALPSRTLCFSSNVSGVPWQPRGTATAVRLQRHLGRIAPCRSLWAGSPRDTEVPDTERRLRVPLIPLDRSLIALYAGESEHMFSFPLHGGYDGFGREPAQR